MKMGFVVSLMLVIAMGALLMAGENQETQIEVNGMECQGCVARVTKALQAIDGVETVKVSLEEGKADVEYTTASVEKMENAILALGFEANNRKPGMTHEEMEQKNPELKEECFTETGGACCAGETGKSGSCDDKSSGKGTKL